MHDADAILKSAAELLAQPTPQLDTGELHAFVEGFMNRRGQFLDLAGRHGSPLYVLDRPALRAAAREFVATFGKHVQQFRPYYAVKSNNCPLIAATLVGEGIGLDVSSGIELQMALNAGSRDIVFSGPGKTLAEMQLALDHADRVVVLIDSFGELARLQAAAAAAGVTIRAGVRLTTLEHGLWRKFGINLSRLGEFMTAAKQCDRVRLCGLQFHTSWNLDPQRQVQFIALLGQTLAALAPQQRGQIEFIDMGGGFWPGAGEWLQEAGTPAGMLRAATTAGWQASLTHYRIAAQPLEVFAAAIAEAQQQHLAPHLNARLCAEPGRWLCHNAMHLLLTVIDRKADDLVITDAGANAVGWERFETDYFPVINLTRPALTERACMVMGSLCTPHDLWGYGYFGQDILEGDVLLVPTQGAYTYSLRQEFIKPLPMVTCLEE
ncbi:MAG: alanine racemase [Planctomycetaceae bacterium]|nr:alanine racemase [Planctomycetaceae bacterium]